MSIQDSIDENRRYYQSAYSTKRGFRAALKRRLSFDQQHKAKLNWRLLSKWIKAGHEVHSVLEIGAGLGLTLALFSYEVLLCATDITEAGARMLYINLKRRQGRKILCCVNDSQGRLPFNFSFDVIIASHVLEHVPDDVRVLVEFERLLSPDGVVLVNVPINEGLLTWKDPKHVRTYDEAELSARLYSSGFRIIARHEADRWGAAFAGSHGTQSVGRRALRAALSLLPFTLVELIGRALFSSMPNTQLALLASHHSAETGNASGRL